MRTRGVPTKWTEAQLIEHFNLESERTPRRWREAGTGPKPVKVGRYWMYSEDEVIAWIEAGGDANAP